MRKISPLTGIRSPDRPACSESLYRLSYPGRRPKHVEQGKIKIKIICNNLCILLVYLHILQRSCMKHVVDLRSPKRHIRFHCSCDIYVFPFTVFVTGFYTNKRVFNDHASFNVCLSRMKPIRNHPWHGEIQHVCQSRWSLHNMVIQSPALCSYPVSRSNSYLSLVWANDWDASLTILSTIKTFVSRRCGIYWVQ